MENTDTSMDVAIIGMAGKFPGADSIQKLWDNICQSVDVRQEFSDEDLKPFAKDMSQINKSDFVRKGYMIKDVAKFDAKFFNLTPKQAKIMDPQQRLFLETAWQGLENAGYASTDESQHIGVYAGANFNNYIFNVGEHLEMRDIVSYFDAMIANDKDYLTSRVAYHLNLTGPAISIQTSCSSSLAAISIAYQALLDYQCDMAIAGGVGLNIPQERGYRYYKEGGLSKDAACHSFDKDASGVMHGNGLGVVILKRLEDALEDEDNIISVIKGATINNDGSKKVAYFTPSVEGQMDAISETLSVTNIDPQNIHYMEAHGPGTPVGDPIEFKALSQAYDVDSSKHYEKTCALGSIKSHLGHLGAASGVAGLINASLILKNRKIPATMHFKDINPEINIENSPFYINTQLKDMDSTYPESLNAAISSFGIGGTNAHIIIQSAPKIDYKNKSWEDSFYFFPLSAKNEKSLQYQTKQLNEYILENRDLSLADISYTLQQRRQHFNHRRFIVAKNYEDLQNQLILEPIPKNQTLITNDKNKIRSIVFMFPGVGDQYINMGRDLYYQQKVFKDTIDECAHLAQEYLNGIDIREVLYPKNEDITQSNKLIHKAEITLTILLSVEYALTKQLEYYGIVPNQMIGHSLGEYCAALVSGVFTLKQALSLVAFRGKLIQSCEPGSMLVVNKDTDKLKEILPQSLSLAVINAEQLNMISGTIIEIEKFEIELKNTNISYTKLPGGRAGHSSTLDPILGEFESFIENMDLQTPSIDFISNVTGDWIKDEEAISAKYWTKHLRQTVEFHKGLSVLIEQENTAFIEIGAGRGLTTIAKRHPKAKRSLSAYASMKSSNKKTDDNNVLYELLGSLWLEQYKIEWEALTPKQHCHLLELPTYAFDRQSYWLERTFNEIQPDSTNPKKREDFNTWFYSPSWIKLSENNQNNLDEKKKNYIVFNTHDKVLNKTINYLEENDNNVICINYGELYKKIDNQNYIINANEMNDYNKLFNDLMEYFDNSFCIIHGWMISEMDSILENNIDKFYTSNSQVLGYYSITSLMRVLTQYNLISKTRLVILSSQLYNIIGEEILSPDKSTLIGPCKVIPYEFPELDFIHMDIDTKSLLDDKAFDSFIRDITSNKPHDKYLSLAYRNGIRWKPYYHPLSSELIKNKSEENLNIKNNGIYLITGAFGGIGTVASNWLMEETSNITLILLSRTNLPKKEQWEEYLAKEKDIDICKRIKHIQSLENKGATVLTYSIDVSDENKMHELQKKIYKEVGQVNGIIHAAGVVGGGLIELEESINFHENLNTKVIGTKLLYKLFANNDLDFILLCSSLGSLVGALGQMENTSANSFLDAFSQALSKNPSSTKVMAINWDYWLEVGMILELADRHKQIAGDEISIGILPKEGKKCFSILLNLLNMPNVVISTADIHQLLKLRSEVTHKTLKMFQDANITKENNDERNNLSTQYLAPRNSIEKVLVSLWENRLGIKIGVNDNFFELGGDSMVALPLMADMRDTLHFDLPIQSLFNEQDVASIATFIFENETSPGTTEQIAEVYLQIQNLSNTEVKQALEN
ncbi:Beta-ketoacyl synthase [Arcobacter nitrofigilis DSM 7299]|uniref:Beta-ketoacyl synthase n=1 Tax=Arcobacter nitrofigilis (strain ATCC 33309 / DSM 7299 / CCUG 15893 / LMG 7604 / NCTC 12251 / CI) TaxID=572480 RepID=D5V0Q1_ARCNC|nr:type I polyketide synthase [Arcobacter nitrofigilis]ADG93863.1 Beta-ketoacyl synthase [Arcobacter nitrofigilis DSM 7299]